MGKPTESHGRIVLLAAIMAVVALAVGCTQVGQVVDPLNVLGLAQTPVRIGVTSLELSPPLLLPKRTLFQENLGFHLKKPVALDLMTTRQIRVHLGTGRLSFAMLSPGEYAEVAPGGNSRILAVPINANGSVYRRGLIITSAKSDIQSLTDLRKKRFHFLPMGDLLNQAAAGAILEAGIARNELDPGFLGLGFDTRHISSFEVAKSVVMEVQAAGIIDEVEYQKWPEKGGSFLLMLPSKDQVRIIAETVRIPEGPIVVSKEASPELVEKMENYLFNIAPKQPLVLASLGYKGFARPIDTVEYEPYFEIHRKLHPTSQPAESQPE